MGSAFAKSGSGLTLQFRAPGTTVPVNLVCTKLNLRITIPATLASKLAGPPLRCLVCALPLR
jgi:hypothetical protein